MTEKKHVIAMGSQELEDFFSDEFEDSPVPCQRAIATLMSMYMDTQDFLIEIGCWEDFLDDVRGDQGAMH